MPDLSFFPESYMVDHALDNPIAFGRAHKEQIGRLVDVADLSLAPFHEAKPQLEEALASSDPFERYWALITCSCFGSDAASLTPTAKGLLDDENLMVRVRAAEFLGITGAIDPRPTLTGVLETTDSDVEALLTLNTVVFFHDRTPNPLPFDIRSVNVKSKGGQVGRRISYLAGE